MMYNQKLVACIKTGGKVLREHGNVVYTPFGCEFSILLKNLNTVRADVRISIDGEDVMDGNSIIVNANSSVELERYLKDLNRGNRFKFVERTSAIENHRGVGAEDGLIRIEYQFEKPFTLAPSPWWNQDTLIYRKECGSEKYHPPFVVGDFLNNVTSPVGSVNTTYSATSSSQQIFANTVRAKSLPQNDAGITVPGSVSDQKFQTVAALNLESETHVIVLQLKGETETNKEVTRPVTVKAKPKCQTCGRVNKATAKFCTECGTSLEVI